MKNGVVNIKDQWVEFLSVLLFFCGIVVSVVLRSAFFSYVVIGLMGLMIGRFLFFQRTQAPYYLIVFSLIVGYILGNRYADWRIVLVTFILTAAFSWWIHEEKWVI